MLLELRALVLDVQLEVLVDERVVVVVEDECDVLDPGSVRVIAVVMGISVWYTSVVHGLIAATPLRSSFAAFTRKSSCFTKLQ